MSEHFVELNERTALPGFQLRVDERFEYCRFLNRRFAMTTLTRLIRKGTIVLLALTAISTTAQADERHDRKRERKESHNYIIERQQAYQVQGVPTSRLIIGKREIDVNRNRLMFEKNNVVGVKP